MILKKILVVSNNTSIKNLVKAAFDKNFMVLATTLEHPIITTTTQHQPLACIIIDIPIINSKTVLPISNLKTHFSTCSIPIVTMSKTISTPKVKLAMSMGADDCLLNHLNQEHLEQRITMSILRSKHNHTINPLTLLPGNTLIDQTLSQKIKNPFALLYVDINNFKKYNDTYGFSMGDQLIKHTANVISTCVKKYGNPHDFVGHIGGDDFVVLSTPEQSRLLAQEICSQFDRAIFNKGTNTLSIAVITNKHNSLQTVFDISQQAALLKNHAKKKLKNKSIFITNESEQSLQSVRNRDTLQKE